MENNYTISFEVEETPEKVYTAINNPRAWWSEDIEGEMDKVNSVFYYHYQDVHRCTIKVTDLVPKKKVVWHVLHNDFNFIEDKSEWNDTDIVFEIREQDNKTEVKFTHIGLVPAYECYDICTDAWGNYVSQSLKSLISEGKGLPNAGDDLVVGDSRH